MLFYTSGYNMVGVGGRGGHIGSLNVPVGAESVPNPSVAGKNNTLVPFFGSSIDVQYNSKNDTGIGDDSEASPRSIFGETSTKRANLTPPSPPMSLNGCTCKESTCRPCRSPHRKSKCLRSTGSGRHLSGMGARTAPKTVTILPARVGRLREGCKKKKSYSKNKMNDRK